jgi:hypothetical protein
LELHEIAEDHQRATRPIAALRDDVWEPFEQRAKVLSHSDTLTTNLSSSERGRWLADLHIDRPLLIGEALESGLFNSLQHKHLGSWLRSRQMKIATTASWSWTMNW